VRLIAVESLGRDDLEAWGRLAERAVEPNPFFERLFVPAAARALESSGVRLLVAEAGGEWIGALPVLVRRRLPGLAVAEGWTHSYSYLGTPLADAGRLPEFAAALAESLAAGEHSRFLVLRRCSTGPVLEALRAACAERRGTAVLFERRFERGAYRRRDTDEPLAWMKGKRRSELKRQRRKLGEELGAEVEVVERTDTAAAVADFLALEASGWKGQQRSALASDERSALLFRQMSAAFAAAGRLQIRALRGDDRALAMTCDIAAGDTLFGFKSAYDESLRRYSPGVQLQTDGFGAFEDGRGEALFDSCAEPGNEMVNAIWPDRRGIATVVFGPGGARGAVARRLLDAAYSRRARDAGSTPAS
jgi:CelD/BcsL family acetyltransferase involved in cellulose biosynthesis